MYLSSAQLRSKALIRVRASGLAVVERLRGGGLSSHSIQSVCRNVHSHTWSTQYEYCKKSVMTGIFDYMAVSPLGDDVEGSGTHPGDTADACDDMIVT